MSRVVLLLPFGKIIKIYKKKETDEGLKINAQRKPKILKALNITTISYPCMFCVSTCNKFSNIHLLYIYYCLCIYSY